MGFVLNDVTILIGEGTPIIVLVLLSTEIKKLIKFNHVFPQNS
jgi:hypothetical protein